MTHWVDKKQFGNVDPDVFKFIDCLTTVQTINKYHQTIRLCDIGAHRGDWSFVMHQLNPFLKDVVLFEPQAQLIPDLLALALPNVKKHIFQYALGDREQQLTLAGGTASASLFETAYNQHYYFPGSTNSESELVDVKILDEVYRQEKLDYPDLLKIDAQGYELNILKGARELLANARFLVLELSLREFYKGQPPLWDLLRFLHEEQYVMLDHGYELRSPKIPNELLQFDAVFVNKRFE